MAVATGIQTESCYSAERMMVTLPRPNTKAPIPKVRSMEELKALRFPTKITMAARLGAYLLSSDTVAMPEPIEGEFDIPEYEVDPSASRKIIIYNEFTIFMPFVISVSIPVLPLN